MDLKVGYSMNSTAIQRIYSYLFTNKILLHSVKKSSKTAIKVVEL